jgi:hypothetical protein
LTLGDRDKTSRILWGHARGRKEKPVELGPGSPHWGRAAFLRQHREEPQRKLSEVGDVDVAVVLDSRPDDTTAFSGRYLATGVSEHFPRWAESIRSLMLTFRVAP